MKCSVEGCEKKGTRKGLCDMHRQRVRKYGTTECKWPRGDAVKCSREGCKRLARKNGLCLHHCDVTTPINLPLAERLARGSVPKSSGCIEWSKSKTNAGYGQIMVGGRGGKMMAAHRVAWELKHGPIPDGLFVCHSCDNKGCVNPDHMFLGSYKDNVDDMVRKGRQKRGRVSRADVEQLRAASNLKEMARYLGVPYGLAWYIKHTPSYRPAD